MRLDLAPCKPYLHGVTGCCPLILDCYFTAPFSNSGIKQSHEINTVICETTDYSKSKVEKSGRFSGAFNARLVSTAGW